MRSHHAITPHWKRAATALLASTIMAAPALAQDRAADRSGASRRRPPRPNRKARRSSSPRPSAPKNLQDVPIAITAFSTKTLDDLQVDAFDDYARLVPSLSYKSAGAAARATSISAASPAARTPTIRRLCRASAPTSTSSRSRPSSGALDIHVFDIARVEALAGPQGTLYGASSQAGTVRIITNKPDFNGTYGAGQSRGEQGRARRLGLYRRRLRQPAARPATSPPASSAGTATTPATSTISAAI